MNLLKDTLSFLFSLFIIFVILAVGYAFGWVEGISSNEYLEKAEELQKETKELLDKMERIVCRYTA